MESKHPIESMLLDGIVIICARISEVEDLTLEKTEEGFKDYTHYIISQEHSRKGKLHQHLVVSVEGCSEASVTETIKKIYPDAKGNKCLYVKKAVRYQQAVKYTLKEGDFKVKGFSQDYVADMRLLSRSKDDMKIKFTRLEEDILLSRITFLEFMKKYIQLKVQHSQPLYDNHIVAYFKRIGIQCGAIELGTYIDNLEFKVFQR